MSERVKLFLQISVAGLLLTLLPVTVWYNSPSQATKKACREAVKERLRSPSTAEFGPAEYDSTLLSRPKAEVRGWGDAATAIANNAVPARSPYERSPSRKG